MIQSGWGVMLPETPCFADCFIMAAHYAQSPQPLSHCMHSAIGVPVTAGLQALIRHCLVNLYNAQPTAALPCDPYVCYCSRWLLPLSLLARGGIYCWGGPPGGKPGRGGKPPGGKPGRGGKPPGKAPGGGMPGRNCISISHTSGLTPKTQPKASARCVCDFTNQYS